ncbi:uncharacterized protein LOC134278088 isoform X3 [Saccostrea cucullata]|uniref:uncharacterized protein LOC134278088 isoform X3 n=1 Tax=Saccostrea cuccullata TaxID=36930 RepID=UPI002ED67827
MSTTESIPMSTTESIPMSSAESIPIFTAESIPMSKVNQEIVILMAGIGVVEVTIIIVGILVVKRFRQQRKSTMKRTSKETNDGRPVSRKTVFGIDDIYDTIPFDESHEIHIKISLKGVRYNLKTPISCQWAEE